MAQQQQFRGDLLFRLHSCGIELSPLRNRREDIPELVTHYLRELSERYGIEPKESAPELLDLLLSFTHDDIKEACRLSALSRSRPYLLLKENKIFRSLPS
jgi:transcriptional regulator of aromatic amino acid metabolism